VDKLGRRLREAREAKGSTLEEAEDATRIRAHFLESLEAGDFAAFPGGDVQVRGFLRIYARYLDLSEHLWRHYGRVLEELERHEELVREKSGGDYVDRMKRGLAHWVSAGREGALAWGIMVFRKESTA